ncbi:MAG: PocR ligand-binding domain-containing protein [Mobilitalea sp.]
MTQQIELITVLKELHNISGFRISLYDTDLNEVSAYPKELTSFCSCIQETQVGSSSCHEYDAKAFAVVKQTGQPYIYRCKFGLWEAVSPLYHYGVLSGYLMMGQTLDSAPESVDSVYYAASRYISNQEHLKKVIQDIPISSSSKISSCISIMEICAAYITLSNGWKMSEKELSNRIKKYLNQHYASKITIESLCEIFLCSKSTLTNTFKNSFGTSIMEFLAQIRIDQAKQLLKNDSLTIKSIAVSCGFSDQNYFTKVFQKYMQMTPSGYRIKP